MKLICSLVLLAFFVVAAVSADAAEKQPEHQSAINAKSVKEKRAIILHHTSPYVYHSPVITTVHHSAPLIHAAPIVHHAAPIVATHAVHTVHPVYSSHVISHAPLVSYYGRR